MNMGLDRGDDVLAKVHEINVTPFMSMRRRHEHSRR
jgi:hypothetical protein